MKKMIALIAVMLVWNSIAFAGELHVNKTENVHVESSDNSGTSANTSVTKTVLTKHSPKPSSITHNKDNRPQESEKAVKQNDIDKSLPKLEMSMPEKKDKSKHRPYEIQMSYLPGRFFDYRKIDRYDVDLLEQFKKNGSVTLYRGITVSRMTGYTTDDGIWKDSNAWGIGPTFMLRWEKPICGKLYGSIEASVNVQVYNRAHPAMGRAFGFLWRVGPRLTYRYSEYEALSLGYIFHHCSNGFQSHNPGYNGIGFSLGYQRSF